MDIQSTRDIYDEISTWYSAECDEKGDLPSKEKNARFECFLKLFDRLKKKGYRLEDIKSRPVTNTIKKYYYPKYENSVIKKYGRPYLDSWKKRVDNDYERALYKMYVPDSEVGKTEKLCIPEPSRIIIEEEFRRQSRELDRSVIVNGMGASRFEANKEVCDFFGIPEDHRE